MLQSTALFCLKERITLKISHVAGVRNEWADILSRGAMRDPSFWAQLSKSKQLFPGWLNLFNSWGYHVSLIAQHALSGVDDRLVLGGTTLSLGELWGGSAAGADLPALQHPPPAMVVFQK